MSRIRINKELTQIVLHHTFDAINTTGERLNKLFNSLNELGSPYDIIINLDGSIDLCPIWTYGVRGNQLTKNTAAFRIKSFNFHYPSQIGTTDELIYNSIHLAVIGDLNNDYPTSQQITTLVSCLNRLSFDFDIDLRSFLFFHNEIESTSCPGMFFPQKQTIIAKSLPTKFKN